jgi:hypothetical protein
MPSRDGVPALCRSSRGTVEPTSDISVPCKARSGRDRTQRPAVLERRDGFIGEFDVWQRLRDGLPDGTVLLCGAKVPHGPSGREIDLLVLWPEVGIAVVEVKGGSVSTDADGTWRSHHHGNARIIGNPMEQASTVRHELHRFLHDKGLTAARARTQHLVVLPHQQLPAGFDPSSCPRAQVVDKGQLTT